MSSSTTQVPEKVVTSKGTNGRQCFMTVQAKKRLEKEGLHRTQRLGVRRVDRQPAGYAARLKEAQGLIQTVDLILAQLARQENTLSELLEEEQSSRDWNILEDKRAKIRIEAVEALKMVL